MKFASFCPLLVALSLLSVDKLTARQVSYQSSSRPMNQKSGLEPKKLVKCNLKAHHAHKLTSNSSRTSSDVTVGLVEPHIIFTSLYPFLFALSLLSVSQNEFWLRVLNPTCNYVTLHPSQSIAQIMPYSENILQIACFNAVNVTSAETLMQVFKSNFSTLNEKQQKTALCLLQKFEDVFANDKWDLGLCNWHELRIQLKEDAQPSRVRYQANNPSKRKDLKEKINRVLKKDFISSTHSKWQLKRY